MKDRVSYTGTLFRMEDGARLFHETADFARWADAMYQQRPP